MNKFICAFIFLGIVMIPFDSVPGIFPSVYRPISLILLIVVFPFVLIMKTFSKQISKINLLLFAFYIVTVLSSFLFSQYKYNDLSGFIDYSLTLTMGMIAFYSFDYYLSVNRRRFNDNEGYIDWIFELIANVYIFVLIIGIFEILILLGILPMEIKNTFASFITGRTTIRIQLTSGETSWASMQMAFIIPIYFYLMKKKPKYKKYFYLSTLIFLMMFSMQGYLIIILGLILYLIIEKKYHKLFKYFSYFLLMITTFIILWKLYEMLMEEKVYYLSRIDSLLNIHDLKDILYLDGSVFIRTAFPYIGLLVFKENFIFGVGGGNFRFELGHYIATYFPSGLVYTEVQDAITNNIGNTKNMFSRLLSETGIIGTSNYLLFIYMLYIRIKKSILFNKDVVKILFIMMITVYFQFDSFAYLHIWLVFAIVNNLSISKINNDLLTK